jgi:hypothetical protein
MRMIACLASNPAFLSVWERWSTMVCCISLDDCPCQDLTYKYRILYGLKSSPVSVTTSRIHISSTPPHIHRLYLILHPINYVQTQRSSLAHLSNVPLSLQPQILS